MKVLVIRMMGESCGPMARALPVRFSSILDAVSLECRRSPSTPSFNR